MITLTREEAQQIINAIEKSWSELCINGIEAKQLSDQAIEMLRARLAQPEHSVEPVAYINVEKRTLEWVSPMRWETPTVVKMDKVPLYPAPPQREWQGLTDEEVNAMHYFMGEKWSTTQLVRHVEAKLKEKNEIR